MKANKQFTNQSLAFWAQVRVISEGAGYTSRKPPEQGSILVPTIEQMKMAMEKRSLAPTYLVSKKGELTGEGKKLHTYFQYRADVLNNFVRPRLMNADEAKSKFEILKKKLQPSCPLPINKQKGEKKTEAYLTGIVNMIIEANIGPSKCDFDPRQLTVITKNGIPLRTLTRRVDGAFPSTNNPIALWEIKEFYHTTTFGSRVADSVYETLLDGMELLELRQSQGIHVLHYLMIDAYETWWIQGRSYLCRIIDALSMGYIDEVLFGYEVIEQLPKIVQGWVKQKNSNVTPSIITFPASLQGASFRKGISRRK